jgi:thioredoxin-like negative regulator of GroEL
VAAVADLAPGAFRRMVIEAERPVLVGFHAEACRPCETQAPILASLARALAGEVRVVRVDVGRAPELAALLEVRSVPTLLLFHEGRIARRFGGVTPGTAIAAALADLAGRRHRG